MELFDLIKSDHKKVKATLEKLMKSSSSAKKSREQGLERLQEDLLPHMYAEEHLFYPLMMEEADREMALEALEEHKAARMVLHELQAVAAGDEHWHPRLKLLTELLTHHIQEEESTIFDQAEQCIDSERAEELGKQFQDLKKHAKVEEMA